MVALLVIGSLGLDMVVSAFRVVLIRLLKYHAYIR